MYYILCSKQERPALLLLLLLLKKSKQACYTPYNSILLCPLPASRKIDQEKNWLSMRASLHVSRVSSPIYYLERNRWESVRQRKQAARRSRDRE